MNGMVFRTSDGYWLTPDSNGNWTDGDLVFDQDATGWPIDDEGNPLAGEFVPAADEQETDDEQD